MAEIICIECKANVSDVSGYCPECGYPFDTACTVQSAVVAGEAESIPQKAIDTPPLDTILLSLDSVTREIRELQRTVTEISSADNTRNLLEEIGKKLDTLAAVASIKGTDAPSATPKKSKKELLALFYKTLNSPNSMFEYMFYICVIQVVFVVVILFLVTYAVMLVR